MPALERINDPLNWEEVLNYFDSSYLPIHSIGFGFLGLN